ncbi:zinc ribbon domain-containing protein [Candidatus Borrarchaeum sp.]|uniref:TIGR00304 family membrane protein n=1 Tax=Candidatus Borrarchaeum sp. TaxID=2846742 RepID=UPI00258028B3|nr:zinc ribbon domain-containing protein [Candidatus Borrarchaeum sp.]
MIPRRSLLGLSSVGFGFILLGIGLIILGMILSSSGTGQSGQIQGGGIILIGPVPIIFGTNTAMLLPLIIIAIIFMILMLALPFIFQKLWIPELPKDLYKTCPVCGQIIPKNARFCHQCGNQVKD